MELNDNSNSHDSQFRCLDMSEIVRKIRNRKQLIEFFFKLGFYLPNYPIFNYDFGSNFCRGNKKVRSFFTKMLRIEESYEVNLPSFKMIQDLTSQNLLLHCVTSHLKDYLPETIMVDSVDRKFLLKLIYVKDYPKFQELESIAICVKQYKEKNRLEIYLYLFLMNLLML